MKFNLLDVKASIEDAVVLDSTGDVFLETQRREVYAVCGSDNPYYRLFYLISKHYKPDFVVELGSWRATSAAHFASGNPAGRVLTIDIHKEDLVAHHIAQQVADYYSNLQFVHGWTWDNHVIDAVKAVSLPIDILYIDAWHHYEHVKREWDLYEPLLADEALVIADDIMDSPGATEGMLKFWDELEYEKFIHVGELHGYIPMGFMRYVR